MRVLSRCIAVTVSTTAIMVALATQSPSARAQCGMMGGGAGGHDHGASQSDHSKKPRASERKQRESVARLLADQQGRMILEDALLQDRDFMWAFVARIVAVPEWRELASRRIHEAGTDSLALTPARQEVLTATYACPMHPEVTSARPGSCPKCGMALERRAASVRSQ